ncbi:hypothetical protein [Tomitella cavernea]|uniref:ABC transporter permease n=1 Tax=Tomitella cavernea TaxID=1387982 RepID=A0ABP9D435_9ACTN|nr:hypothetical protein [Tomitella cavernea]
MIANVQGEWTKMITTRAPLATVLLAFAALAGVGAMRTLTADGTLTATQLLEGASTGLLVVLALGTVAATAEHTHGTYAMTLLADAGKTRFFLAKLCASAALCAGAAVLGAAVLSLVGVVAPNVEFDWAAGDIRPVWVVVPLWALCGVIGVSVGTLVRHTAPAVVLVVLWPAALEPLAAGIPGVGDRIAAWLPFRNAVELYQPGSLPVDLAHGPWAAFAVVAVFTVVLAAAAASVDALRNG